MEILSIKEWYKQKKNFVLNNSDEKILNEYAKYLLEKQAEFIAEMCIGENLIKLASNEFIKQLK